MARPHEFLQPVWPQYRECDYCGERKSMVCMACSCCYGCHPAIEQAERAAPVVEA
jgi:hypothetical protein